MFRLAFLAIGLLLFSPTAFGQTASPESQTLQALLTEVHQLRQDLQTAAAAARKAQILIYRLHVQETAVARASQRLDQATSALDQFQAQRKWQALQIKRYEDMRGRAENPDARKQFDDAISDLKAQMDAWVPEEQEAQAKELGFAEQLRMEQAKLDQLQNELDQLDRAVMSVALRPAGTPQ
jgi:hypothetical protein